jgi:hypothetical protein
MMCEPAGVCLVATRSSSKTAVTTDSNVDEPMQELPMAYEGLDRQQVRPLLRQHHVPAATPSTKSRVLVQQLRRQAPVLSSRP